MRRIIVVVLIFLFPLQVFAASSDWQLPTHASAAERLTVSETIFHEADAQTSGWDASEELPAGADFNDSLGQDPHVRPVGRLAYAKPVYIAPLDRPLCLPVAKPPPIEQFQPDCEGSAGRSEAIAALPMLGRKLPCLRSAPCTRLRSARQIASLPAQSG